MILNSFFSQPVSCGLSVLLSLKGTFTRPFAFLSLFLECHQSVWHGLAVPIWPLASLLISHTFPPFVSNKRMRAWAHAQQLLFSEGRGKLACFCKLAWQLLTSRRRAPLIGFLILGRWLSVAKRQALAENPRNSRCHGNSVFTRLLCHFR